MKVRDEKTGKLRDETEDERKVREDAAAAGGDGDGDGEEDGEGTGATLATVTTDRDRWKGEARKWEKRAKDNFAAKIGIPWDAVTEAAQKFQELDSKNKSDTEKAVEAQAKSDARAAAAERENLVLKVAMRKGLTDKQAKRLMGNTEEELEIDADELLKSFKAAEEEEEQAPAPGTRVTRRPAEALRPGSGKRPEPPIDVKKIVDQVQGIPA